jgi:hypothetical protein
MAATPLVAARGTTGVVRRACQAAALLSTSALVVSVVAEEGGGLQRLGLTVVDAWHVAVASAVLLRRRP